MGIYAFSRLGPTLLCALYIGNITNAKDVLLLSKSLTTEPSYHTTLQIFNMQHIKPLTLNHFLHRFHVPATFFSKGSTYMFYVSH